VVCSVNFDDSATRFRQIYRQEPLVDRSKAIIMEQNRSVADIGSFEPAPASIMGRIYFS
jgi:hypothetical protein